MKKTLGEFLETIESRGMYRSVPLDRSDLKKVGKLSRAVAVAFAEQDKTRAIIRSTRKDLDSIRKGTTGHAAAILSNVIGHLEAWDNHLRASERSIDKAIDALEELKKL